MKSILAITFTLFYLNSFSQANFQDYQTFERIQSIDRDLEYTYPYRLISSSFKNEIVLIERNSSRSDNGNYYYKGVFIDLDKERETNFEVSLEGRQLRDFDNILNCNFNDDYLLINFTDKQFIFERGSSEMSPIREFEKSNSTGLSYIDDKYIFLSSLGKFGRADTQRVNYFSRISIEEEDNTLIKVFELKGKAFQSTFPSSFIDYSKSWVGWIEPIDHTLFLFNRKTSVIDTVRLDIKNWVRASPIDIYELNEIREITELLTPLREIDLEISRVWSICFIDDNTILTVFHHPDEESGYMFYANVIGYESGKWSVIKSDLFLSSWRYLDPNTEITKANFPFLHGQLGSKFIITEDYSCILIEENDIDLSGLKFNDLITKKREKSYGLKMHVFKHKF